MKVFVQVFARKNLLAQAFVLAILVAGSSGFPACGAWRSAGLI